uniref:Uncharacterized protein n=1 Tax=Trichogramma kaykai TaxID=54128 RepID=A0ABD2VZE2_9HYME
MSSIKTLIASIENEEKIMKQTIQNEFDENRRKYADILNKINFFKGDYLSKLVDFQNNNLRFLLTDENKKNMDSILKGLDKLVAIKHTIEKALEQTEENFASLPVPFEQHSETIELISKMAEYISNAGSTSNANDFVADQILHDTIAVTESVENDLKECHTDFNQAQALYNNTKVLRSLMDETSEEDPEENINDSIFSSDQ